MEFSNWAEMADFRIRQKCSNLVDMAVFSNSAEIAEILGFGGNGGIFEFGGNGGIFEFGGNCGNTRIWWKWWNF